jgi:hypothetical protein
MALINDSKDQVTPRENLQDKRESRLVLFFYKEIEQR